MHVRFTFIGLFMVYCCCYPANARAIHSPLYSLCDSTTHTLVIKKSSQVKASAVVGQTISIKTADGYSIIGTLNDIQETYLTIDQTQIPISAIVWIKIRNKHKNITTTILKWIGIAAGIALLGFISFAVIFAIAYAGGSGTSFLIGLLLLSGLFYLFLKIVSRKKYRLSKYDLEIQ